MKKLRCALLAVLALGCTDESSTRHALANEGFTDVEITGFDLWACGDDDFSCTAFTATNPQGARVEGAVGCGLILKSCTVRW